jgi:hypothetical protein
MGLSPSLRLPGAEAVLRLEHRRATQIPFVPVAGSLPTGRVCVESHCRQSRLRPCDQDGRSFAPPPEVRQEHAELLPHLESLLMAAIVVEGIDNEVPAALDTVLAFLRDSLIPHARAEDAALHPVVEQVMNAPGATATISRDHLELVRLTANLERLRESFQGPDPDSRRELQRTLVRAVCHHPAALRQRGGGVPALD